VKLDGTSDFQSSGSVGSGTSTARPEGDFSTGSQSVGVQSGGSVGNQAAMPAGSLSAVSPDATNRPWRIEQSGIGVVPQQARSGTAWDLFWVWFAANIGILGVVLGAIVLAFGLNLWQSILVIAGGTLTSFALVGAFSIAGWQGRVPMMTLSRAIFGIYGNFLPNVASWVSLVGWETITVITGTLAMMALLGMYFHCR